MLQLIQNGYCKVSGKKNPYYLLFTLTFKTTKTAATFIGKLQEGLQELGGPDSSVGIATDYGWTVRDRIPVGTRFSAHPDRPWGPTQPPVKWV